MTSAFNEWTEEQVFDIFRQGRMLGENAAGALEQLLLDNPDDSAIRLSLIAYHGTNRGSAHQKFDHVFWFIDRHPNHRAWREILSAGIRQNFPQKLFEQAIERWLCKIKDHPSDSNVIGFAGLFIVERAHELGDELLSNAIELDPCEEFWPWQLAHYRFLYARDALASERTVRAKAALDAGIAFIDTFGCEGGRRLSGLREMGLSLCAKAAYWTDDLAMAKFYATEHLTLMQEWKHVLPKSSRSVLGLIALKEGELDSAREHLLFLKRHSLVDSWDLQLANEFLKLGESKTVLKYLHKCKRFGIWDGVGERLDEWIHAVANGEPTTLG